MRPVDADVLIPLIQEDKIEGKILDIVKALGDGLQAETLNQACDRHIKMINSLPTIDVTPIKHGEWIHGREVSRDYVGDACVCIHYEKWWCSECNYTVDLGEPLLWHYCPVCGANMSERKNYVVD